MTGLASSVTRDEQAAEIDFLGFEISKGSIRASQSLTDKVIINMSPPSCVREVRSPAGMLAFVHQHVPHLAQNVVVINQLQRTNTPFEWTSERQAAFESILNAVREKPILRHYKHNAETRLYTNASISGLGRALMQMQNRDQVAISYFSRVH